MNPQEVAVEPCRRSLVIIALAVGDVTFTNAQVVQHRG
jgi:hypothetical protein